MNDTVQERMVQLALSLRDREGWLVAIESGVYFILILTACLGNILLSLAIYKTRSLRISAQNYYLVSLAATDVLSAIVGMPLTLVVLIKGTWPFGDFICQFQGFVLLIAAFVSLLTLGMISINRYVKIVRSASLYQKIFRRGNVLKSIAISWIVAVFTVLGAFLFSKEAFHYHPGKGLCSIKYDLTSNVGLYFSFFFVTGTSVTCSTIVFSYYKVFRKIRAHFAQVANSSLHNNNSSAFAEEVKITTLLFITILAFFICWTPSVIVDLYESLGRFHTLPRQVYFFNVFTFQSSHAVNPIIYGLMKREFKEGYKNILCCKDSQ
ncbi:melatonin receptor type 1B-B-like [Oculina patagonica]